MLELLKKWLDGSTNWTAEKELRNQAHEDDFLADALEGFDALPQMDHTQNISALERRLQERIDKKKKPIVYPLRAIAAALLLLLSAGIWWNLQSSLDQAPIAETSISSKAPSKISPPAPSTNTLTDNRAQEKGTIAYSQKIVPSKESAESIIVQKELSTTVLSNKQKAFPNDPAQTIIKTTIAPSIAIEEEAIIVAEETTPEVTFNKAESARAEEADGIAYLDKKSLARPAPAAMVEESNLVSSPLSDEGIVHAITESKTKTSRAAKRKLSDTPKALPAGGLEAFKEYIKDNKNYPALAKTENIKGTVFLVFKIKANGRVKNIEVTKSLHPAYDAEAIRLLQEGPKWISPTGIGYYEISFGLEE